ncbi:MAG: cation diffusion facilitator family transporter [Thermodesulfobacteriota bacterium]
MFFGDRKSNTALLSVFSNTCLILVKLVVGIIIGSISIISEAIHSGVDLLAALIALFAVKKSSKPADSEHPFGHGKVENISGAIEALLIFAAAGWIIYESIHKFQHPTMMGHAGWGALVMLFSVVVNIFVSNILFKVGNETDSMALQADAWHLRTDVYTSAGVLFAMLVIWGGDLLGTQLDLGWIDPAVAILVAMLILKAAFQLTGQTVADLMDQGLPESEEAVVKESIEMFTPMVRGYHNLRTRKSGSSRFIEFHLMMDPGISVQDSHKMTEEVSKLIKKQFSDTNITIHVEPCDGNCTAKCAKGCLTYKHYMDER